MSKRFRILTVALLLVASAGLATPTLAQSPALVSATPQQKDAWGEDIVRYCAAEIQASVRADTVGDERKKLAEDLDYLANDVFGLPKPYVAFETDMMNASQVRAEYAEAAKDPTQASLMPWMKRRMIKAEARACMAGRAITLMSANRETVTIWNKSPDTVEFWLGSPSLGDTQKKVCIIQRNQFCTVSLPVGSRVDLMGEVGGAVKHGPYTFDPVGDATQTFVLTRPGQ